MLFSRGVGSQGIFGGINKSKATHALLSSENLHFLFCFTENLPEPKDNRKSDWYRHQSPGECPHGRLGPFTYDLSVDSFLFYFVFLIIFHWKS